MKLISFSRLSSYWEKLKTLYNLSFTDAIQKSPSRKLSSERRKKRGNGQDLFLKTENFMHLKAGREVKKLSRAGGRKTG